MRDNNRSARRRLGNALAAYPLLVAALMVWFVFVPHRSGVLALAQILLGHLLLSAVLLIPVAAALRHRVLAVALLVLALVAVVRLGSEWASVPVASSDMSDIRVLSWNLEVGARSAAEVVAGLRESEADVVALQELTPEAAAAIEADSVVTGRFPHRVLVPDPTVLGMGLLSKHRIASHELSADPAGIEAHLDVMGNTLVVVNAHPLPGRITTGPLGLPVAFDATNRDAGLLRVRARIDRLMLDQSPLIVVGDFNVAPTEPAYQSLASGLRDAHVEAGQGPGWTWRPSRLEGFGFGLLRIDYVLTSPAVRVTAARVDCSRTGDHCQLNAALDLP